MIQKLVKEEKIGESGEVELLLMILELQEKYDDALLILKGSYNAMTVQKCPNYNVCRSQNR